MSAENSDNISLADYLAAQQPGGARSEFCGGGVFALEPGSPAHDRISQNVFDALQLNVLNGFQCIRRADTLVRIDLDPATICYYPDVVVAELRLGGNEPYLRSPKLVVEVFSRSTEVNDCRGKKIFYVRTPSLDELVFIAEHRREVRVLRRASAWRVETFTAPDASIEFQSVRHAMTLAQIYEGVS